MPHNFFTVLLLAMTVSALSACDQKAVTEPDTQTLPPLIVDVVPASPRLSRITRVQYANIMADLFGESVIVPANLEPDHANKGLIAVGSSVTSVSPLGVERYSDAAYSIAEQILGNDALKSQLLVCEGQSPTDKSCLTEIIETWATRLWRRPITADETTRLVAVGVKAGETLNSFTEAVRYVLAGLLQSPNFLYLRTMGEPHPDDESTRRYTDWEMASRLSFFLWNSAPDAALLEAAAKGQLTDEEGLAVQVDRMLAHPHVKRAVRNFFSDWLGLAALEGLNKDPSVYKHYAPELGSFAREETLLLIEHLVFDEDADIRTLMTTKTTFVNRRLAAIYNVPALQEDGFAKITLPDSNPRRGFLGHVAFLALEAHAESSSPSLRGLFVRKNLLCHHVPAPPANVNTDIPEPSDDAITMRDRLMVHMEDPSCSPCHELMDPIGFGFESFDGIGRYRILDNGAPVDPSGYLDKKDFANFDEMVNLIAEHPDFPSCAVRKVYAYARTHDESSNEPLQLNALTARFAAQGYRFLALMRDISLSPGFRLVGEVSP